MLPLVAALALSQVQAAPSSANIQPDQAATAEAIPTARPPRSPPPFRLFRYDEDYSRLADDTQRTDFFDAVRYLPLSDDGAWRLTIGGEARTRYEYTRHPGFGLRGLEHDDFVAQRFLVHADLRAHERVRAFVQLASGLQSGNESPTSPSQANALELQQAFLDVIPYKEQDMQLTLRAGRMEMGFGSYRLATSRDPTNTRLNFDGARGTLRTSNTTIDAFLTRPVRQQREIFDDSPDRDQAFWGVYSVTPLAAQGVLSLDAYYLGLERAQARFASGAADELRHSVGARLWGKTAPTGAALDYDVEAVFQFGTWGDQDIRAWTIASNTGYTFEAAWKPRVGLKANIASGDDDASDDTLATFNALFPRNNYFNDANLVAPANFFNVHPSLQVSPMERLTLTTSADFFFRLESSDAVYAPGRIAIPPGTSGDSHVGTALTLQADWIITPNVSLAASATYFAAGDVVSDAGGKDVTFFGTWLTFRF